MKKERKLKRSRNYLLFLAVMLLLTFFYDLVSEGLTSSTMLRGVAAIVTFLVAIKEHKSIKE